MLRRAKKHRKKLARLVLAALLCTGGAYGLMSPSVAAAADPVTVTGYSNGAFTPSGSMTTVYNSGYYTAYPADGTVTVLNIAPGEADTWISGNTVSVYGHYTAGVSASASGYTVNMTGTKAQVNNLYGSYNFEYFYYLHTSDEVTVGADGNKVTVKEGASVNGNVAGGYNSTEAYYVYDSFSGNSVNLGVTARADTNTVTIEGSAVGGNVYGGNNSFSGYYSYAYYSSSTVNIGTTTGADNNTVTINGAATVGKNVYGGYNSDYTINYSSGYGDTKHTANMSANINEVTISGEAVVGGFVYGGYASAYVEYGTAGSISTETNNNTVTISDDASVGAKVYGGYAYANTYTFDYAALAHTADTTANANKNEVTISGNAVVGTTSSYDTAVYGGSALAGAYAYNYEYATDATATATANANENEVTISGNAVIDSASAYEARIYGGYANAVASPYYAYNRTATATASANENTVIISEKANAKVRVYAGYAKASGSYGSNADATADANKNEVTVSGEAAVGDSVYAGYAEASPSGSDGIKINAKANTNENAVSISDQVAVSGSVYGGSANVSGSGGTTVTAAANANENNITISDQAAVNDYVYGGYANASGSGGTAVTAAANANDNIITISDQAAVNGYVYGGYAYASVSGIYKTTNTSKGTAGASNNTVTVSGSTDSDAAVTVKYNAVGGYAYGQAYANAQNSESSVTSDSTVDVTSNKNRVDISSNASVGSGYEALIVGGFNNTSIRAYAYYSENTATAGGTANANENEVIISDAVIGSAGYNNDAVYGGYNTTDVQAYSTYAGSAATAEGTANANQNTVTVSGAADVDSDIYGGRNRTNVVAYGYDTTTAGLTASAYKNEITISDQAAVAGAVYGGYNYTNLSYAYTAYGTTTAGLTADANENTVTISGAAGVDSAVYGGHNETIAAYVYAYYNGTKANVEVTASADKNIITISSDAAASGDVYGGHNITSVQKSYAYYEGSELTAELTASADKNEIEISGAVGGAVYGGYNKTNANRVIASETGSKATVGLTASTNENSVTVNDSATVRGVVYGGYNYVDADAAHSSDGYYYDYEYGHGILTNTVNAAASNNDVSISGAAVSQDVIGGEAYTYARYGPTNNAEGTASANEIIISDNASVGGTVYGGRANAYTYSGHQRNAPVTATSTSTANANENKITISDTAITGYSAVIYGSTAAASAYAYYGTTNIAEGTASADNNTVTISDTAASSASVVYYAMIYGGYAYASTSASKGTTNSAEATASADSNTIIIRDVVVDPSYYMSIYGGYAYVSADANASEAPATADGLTVNAAASANNNTVTISGDTVIGSAAEYYVQITGGYAVGTASTYVGNSLTDDAELTASANNNTVTISGGTVGGAANAKNNFIIGGYSNVEASGNTVTIEGDTTKVYTGAVVGGGYTTYSASNTVSGKAVGNTVTISAEGAEVGQVYGGRTVKGDASENKVTISAGSVTGNVASSSSYYYYSIAYGAAAVAGGYADIDGNATLNTVEISGVTVSVPENASSAAGSGSGTASVPVITMAVVGGYAGGGDATNNTVKLQDTTITGGVYGGATASSGDTGGSSGGTGDLVTGNTLVIGGINTVDGEVTNFETIKLADTVEWSSGTTVLKADRFTDNADGTRASLDITDAETNLATATSGSMALLASDTEDDFKTLSLVYSGGTAALSETNKIKVIKSYDATTETTPTNGVTLTYASSQVVSLDKDNDYKNVLYKIQNITSNVSLGDMTWENGRDLAGDYTFGDTVVVDATNLNFADTTTLLKKDDSTVLVANATGITSSVTPTAGTGKTIGVNYNDSKTGIAYEATASGNVTAVTDALQYIISSVTTDKITLGSQAWGTTADMPDASWTASASTQIDDTAFAYTGEATTALKANDTATILNAKGLTTASPVTAGTDKAVGINYTDNAGVNYVATATGHVAAAADAVNYVVDSVAVTGGVNLQNWNGKDTSAVTEGWTGTGVAVATGTFTAPGDMKLGDKRTIATAATGFFGDVSGSNAFPGDGGTLSENVGGVKLTGSMIGGVKAEDDGAMLTYYAMKKTADTMTLGTFTFVNGDGNARKYGREYDLTNADIITDDLIFTDASKKNMEAGNKMTLVDASGAYKDGAVALKPLAAGAKTGFDVDFSDAVAVTNQAGITFTGTHTDTLSMVGDQKLEYTVGNKVVENAKLDGTINWIDNGTHYKNTKYTFDDNSKVDIENVKFVSASDPKDKSMTLITIATGMDATNVSGTPDFTVTLNNTTLTATSVGTASVENSDLKYTVTGLTLDKVTVNETGNDIVPEGWTTAANVAVDTDSMTIPSDIAAGSEMAILTANAVNTFSDENITGRNTYKESTFTDASNPDDTTKGVSLIGTQSKGVKASEDGTSLVYAASKKEVSTVNAGAVNWKKETTLFDGSDGYDYSKVASIGTDGFEVTYGDGVPETLSAGDSMTLLKANETLKDMAAAEKKSSYSFTPVSGVTVDAAVTGKLAVKDGVLTYTAAENRADKLTFGDVQWNAGSPLLKRPSNIIFAGADVDTAKINFVNMSYLDANQKMTLISDFGDSVGTITGSKYMVGTAFEGEGTASLKGSDLIFTTKTEAGLSEQTHKTVMAMDAGLAMLKTGNEFIGKAIDGLADVRNRGKDGVSTFASVGGGASRYSTGSHVNTHTWNAVVGVGKTSETKQGTVEYGIFGEYGKGSYTLHSNAGNGDGDAHYAGGGVLAKFTNKQNVYTEASFHVGRLSDSSSDIMRDGLGNAYGYDVHASYYGAHLGAGKIINYKDGKSLDVYGKFFYLKRDGVEYDAVQHYNLDSVSSSILRLGARYGTTDKKWNWYGGLAYEYEFDGEAKGTVNGKEIRAASIRGSSVRGEFGMRMDATKTNPWSTDISLYGYGGKHRGFGGNVSVAYTF